MAQSWCMKIEAYDFGTITIDGKIYTSDIKIVRGVVYPGWWRKEGHNLLPEDIEDILAAEPALLVVGTGHNGLMAVSGAAKDRLHEAGIELVAEPTRQACDRFNKLITRGDTAFAAHLTC